MYVIDNPLIMCPVSDLLNAVLKFIQANRNKKIKDIFDSIVTSSLFLNNKFIVKTPVTIINKRALVDLASPEKKGVG